MTDHTPSESNSFKPVSQRVQLVRRSHSQMGQQNSTIDQTIDTIVSAVAETGDIESRSDSHQLRQTAELILVNAMTMGNLHG